MVFLVVQGQDSTNSLTSTITIFSKARDMSSSHTRNFRSKENFSDKYVPVSPMKLVRYWSHAFWVKIDETYTRNFSSPSKITDEKRKKKKKKKDNCEVFCVTQKCGKRIKNITIKLL